MSLDAAYRKESEGTFMAKVIAIANQKGGVAKTTTTAALGAGLKQKGFRVLTIDADPQGNLSDSVGADNRTSDTVYELLKNEVEAADAIQHLEVFDIIPANIMLAGAEQEISQIGKEQRMKERIASVMDRYDYIIVDTPPSLGLLTINAFTAADEVIIPTTAGIFAASGIVQLFETIKNVRKYCNSKIRIAGVLLTRFNPRTNTNQDMRELTEKIANSMEAELFKTFIRSSVVVEEAQVRKEDILTYKEKSTVAEDYKAFIEEYLEGAQD